MITDEKCSRALSYLTSTDEEAAELKTQVARAEYLVELARKREFLSAEGSVEARKALAEVSDRVKQAQNNYLDALLSFEKMRARRVTAALIVDTWRTCSANARSGNI